MARIRTIKPEFWTSEQVVECSPTARLMFIGLWNFCDDGGNHPASTKTLKMEVFPGDDITNDTIQRMIDELLHNGLIIEYVVDNKSFWHVCGWHHQKVEKPNKKYPTPPKFGEESPTGRRPFDDQTPEEGKGRDNRKGKEEKPPTPFLKGATPAFDPLTLPLPDCVPLAAWAEWIAYRKERRLTCRHQTLTKQADFLAAANSRGHTPASIIELAIRNGWQGLFEPKATATPFTPTPVNRQARRVYQ